MANDSVARAMAATAMSETPVYTSDLINNGTGNSPFSIVSETGHRIDLEMNSTTYEMVAKLYDKNNNLLNTSTAIDLPLESLVVNVQYDAANQKLIVTLKNGTTIDVPISGLISGLATQTWVQSQGYLTEHQSLSAYRTSAAQDIIDNGKQDTLTAGQNITIVDNVISATGGGQSGIFYASYDNTKYSEILTAYNSGLEVLLKDVASVPNHVFHLESINTSTKVAKFTVFYLSNQRAFVTCEDKNDDLPHWYGPSYTPLQNELTAGSNITINSNTISATDTTYSDATTSESGLMSASDKTKLNGLVDVSGTNDGTNWSTITIDGTTKNIPSGGGSAAGAVRYDEALSLTESQENQAWSNLLLGCSKVTSYKNVVASAIEKTTSAQQPTWSSSECSIDITGLSGTSLKFKLEFEVSTDGTNYTTYTYNNLIPEDYSGFFRFQPATSPVIYRADVWSYQAQITFSSAGVTRYIRNFSIQSMTSSTTYTTIDSNLLPAIPTVPTGIKNGNNAKSVIIGDGYATALGGCATVIGNGQSSKSSLYIANGNGAIAFGRFDSMGSSSAKIQAGYYTGTDYSYNDSNVAGGHCRGGLILAGTTSTLILGAFAIGNTNAGIIQAEGNGAIAAGYSYSAYGIKAMADGAIALGINVHATTDGQMAVGKYNVEDNSKAFIIGNGNIDIQSNALTVDWDGNLVCNNIPAPPASDGNYVLKCSISSGVASYSWVAE